MLRNFFCVALIAMISAPAHAGVIGNSEVVVSNIKFTKAGGANVTGSFTTGASDFRISNITTTSSNTAYLSSLGGDFQSQSLAINQEGVGSGAVLNGGTNLGPNFAAPAAYVGPGGTPVPGNRDPLAADYVRSDSVFGGSFVQLIQPVTNPHNAGVLNLPVGGEGTSYADFSVDTPGLIGEGNGTIDTTSSAIVRVDFSAITTFQGSFSFDARSLINLVSTAGLDPAYALTGSTNLTVTLSGVGVNFATGTALSPNLLNAAIGLTGPGNASYDSGLVFFDTGLLTFTEGNNYSLTILQNAAVALNPVPEPASLAIFGCVCVAGAIGSRRRMKKS